MSQILFWTPFVLFALASIGALLVISRMAGTVEARMWLAYGAARERESREAAGVNIVIPPRAKAKASKTAEPSEVEHTAEQRWQQVLAYNRSKRLCRLGALVVAMVFIDTAAILMLPPWASLALTIVTLGAGMLGAWAALRPLSRPTADAHTVSAS